MMKFNILLILISIIKAAISNSNYDSCFSKHPNLYLEQSGRLQIPQMENKTSCLTACIMAEAQHGFHCKTVMWHSTQSNCVLSRWSIAQKRSRLRKSIAGDIDLYSNHCFIKTGTRKNVRYLPSPTRDIRHIWDYQSKILQRFDPSKVSNTEDKAITTHAEALHEISEIVSTSLDSPTLREISNDSISLPKTTTTTSTDLQPWQMAAMRKFPVRKHHHPLLSVLATTLATPKTTQTSSMSPQRTTVSIKSRQSRNLIDRDSTASLLSPAKSDLSTDNLKLFSPCFRRNRGYALRGFAEKLLQEIGLEECLMSCMKNTQFYCASINYNEKNMLCILNGGNSRLNHASIEPNKNMDYYENLCSPLTTVSHPVPNSQIIISEEVLKRCVFGTKESTLLSLTGDIQPDTPTLAHCISLCLLAKTHKNRECTAVNWLGNMRSCTLFYEAIDSKLISPSPQSYFYENQCSDEIFGEKTKNQTRKEDFDYS